MELLATLQQVAESAAGHINKRLSRHKPLNIALAAAAFTYAAMRLNGLYRNHGTSLRIQRKFVKWLRLIPSVQRQITQQGDDIKREVAASFKRFDGEVVHQSLPENGLSVDKVWKEASAVAELNTKGWEKGIFSGTIYHGGEELTELLVKVHKLFHWSNPLHSDSFAGVKKMEAEVISMVLTMYNAPPGAAGSVTSGGTESILMAMKTYRDYSLEEKGVTSPNIVAPISAHPAFDKACAYFNIEIRKAPLDSKSGEVNVGKLKSLVDSNTIAVVLSAPNYSCGTIDPIREVSKWCHKRNTPLHVDCCLGSFLVPFMKDAGFEDSVVDFRNEGVTSISCDTHKFGYSPKGSSVILYRSEELRRFQFFFVGRWPGGMYASPTMSGSRPGAIVAATWATLIHFGKDGYRDACRAVVTSTRRLAEGVKKIPGLDLIGRSDVSVVAIKSIDEGLNIYCVGEQIAKKGWKLSTLQNPPGLHLSLTHVHSRGDTVDRLLVDLKEAVEYTRQHPSKPQGFGAMYGVAAKIPEKLVKEFADIYWDVYYSAVQPGERLTPSGTIQRPVAF